MKKVIEGAVYNTETAKKICEQYTEEIDNEKGAEVKKLKQLYKTKSNNFFFFISNNFIGDVDVNNDDLNPKYEETELWEEKIMPINYELAFQFASEVNSDSESNKMIGKYFPELTDGLITPDKKIQKKLYISEKANWYLELMLQEGKDTNSSFVEKLITAEYQRLYKKGMMLRDPFFEMEK